MKIGARSLPPADGRKDAEAIAVFQGLREVGGAVVDEEDSGLVRRHAQPVEHLADRLPRLDLDLDRRGATYVAAERGVEVNFDLTHVFRGVAFLPVFSVIRLAVENGSRELPSERHATNPPLGESQNRTSLQFVGHRFARNMDVQLPPLRVV